MAVSVRYVQIYMSLSAENGGNWIQLFNFEVIGIPDTGACSLSTHQNDSAAIVHGGAASNTSAGLAIANSSFLSDAAGDRIAFGYNNAAFAVITDNMASSTGDKRWAHLGDECQR